MYVTIGGLWKRINNGYITIGGVWKKINAGYVTIGGVWKKFFSAEPIPSISTYPKVRNSGGTDINNTTVKSNTGDVLYGYRGSWLNNPTSYENKWQWSAYSGGPYSDFSPSQTATTLSTAGNISTWDKRYIVYVVRATNATGTSSWVTSSNEAYLVKYTPSNISISISGTATIGQTLIGISSWETTNINSGDWTPDTYLYEWIYGDTGTAAFNSTNSSNYAITSEDNGHTIKVKITATNSGGSTTATSTATATITVAKPTNTSAPTFSLLSGTANRVGSVYRLSAGSWTNTPTSYTYYLDRNNAAGTNVLALNQSGAYYDWTVGGTYGGNTLSFYVTATNAGGTSSPATYASSNLGPFLVTVIPTVTIAANTSVTTTTGQINWTSTDQYGFSVDGAFAASGSPSSSSGVYKTGLTPNTTYTGTITVTSSTGNTATASYSLTTPPIPVYTVTYLKNDGSGTAQGTSTFTSGGPTTSASTPTRAGYTFNGWYDTGSLDYTYLVQASTSWFPPDGNRNMYARWTLTPVIPTITMGANSGVTQTSGTINWSSSNQSSFSSDGSISGTGTTATSITNNSLSPGTTYTGTVTVTSSTGNTASANYSLITSPAQYTVTWNAGGGSGGGSTGPFNAGTAHTAPSPGTRSGFTFNGYYNTPSGDYLYGPISTGGSFVAPSNITMHARWTASTSAPGTPVVSGDNSLSVGGTFTWSCTGSPTPVYRVTIGYNASNSAGPFSTRYQQPSAALTTSNGLSITSIRPGYDLSPGLGWAGTGYYRCTIQAINSAGGPTTGSATVYMS